MRNSRALAVSAAAAALLGVPAPAAVAGDSPANIVALPGVIARGGQITVTVDGCPRGGAMYSDAFGTATLSPVSGSNRTSRGAATIYDDARAGTYDIAVQCSGRRLTRPNAFTVIGGVRGGLGGSISNGATPTDVAIGGGLVASAVIGGGVFLMRRRAVSPF